MLKWKLLFISCIPFGLYRALKEPAWAAAFAMYFYFAIPQREFGIGGKFPLIMQVLAVLGSLRYYSLFKKWEKEEIKTEARVVGDTIVDEIGPDLAMAAIRKTAEGGLPGQIRAVAVAAAEERLDVLVGDKAPAPIKVPVARVLKDAISRAADAAEEEGLEILNSSHNRPQGYLHAQASSRIGPVVTQAVSEGLSEAMDDGIEREFERFAKSETGRREGAGSGALGGPMPRGPVEGILTNSGVWVHVLWTLVTFLGIATAQRNPYKAAGLFSTCQLLFIPLVTIISAIRTPKHFFLAAVAWCFGVWHLAMNGITYWVQYGGRADDIGGQGGESNFLGAIIVAVAPVALGLAVGMKDVRARLVALGVAGCFVLGVLASGSRAGLVALILCCGYWLMNTNRKAVAFGIGLLACAGFLAVAPDSFWERMGTMFGEQDNNRWVVSAVEPSAESRLILWDLALDLWREHPVNGVGPGNYVDFSATETTFEDAYGQGRGLQAHNSWFQILAEYGIVGFLIWVGGFLTSAVSFRIARWRLRKYERYEWFCAICLGFEAGALGTIGALMFNSFHWYDYLYWYFVFGPLALQIAIYAEAREEWFKPTGYGSARPAPRYAKPSQAGLDLSEVDLADAAPLSRE